MSQVSISTRKRRPGYETLGQWHRVAMPEKATHEDRLLAIANRLLAESRFHAWDHERGGEMFHGAALVRTEDGNYYVSSNIHVQNPKVTRSCAEANSITDAVYVEGPNKMQITDLYFMGGKADLEKSITILPGGLGKRYTPCGSCCDAIWNHRLRLPGTVGRTTHVHMLPLNDGSWKLKPDDGRPVEELEPNQVMSRTIDQLLPMKFQVADEMGKLKESIRRGWEYVQDAGSIKAMDMAIKSNALVALSGMKHASGEEVARAVNDLMMDTVKDVICKARVAPQSMNVTVVRMDNGEFYMGTSVEDGFAPATSSAAAQALDQATMERLKGHSLTDVFVLSVNAETMPALLEAFQQAPKAALEVHMPDGATRERISKLSPYNGQEFKDVMGQLVNARSGASVHVMMPNNKADFDPTLHMVSYSLEKLLPYRYTFPKMEKVNGQAEAGSVTLG